MSIRQSGFLKDLQGTYIVKDPQASLQYGVDWSDWLEIGDTVTTSTWTVETTGTNQIVASGPGILDDVAFVTLTGGTDGVIYTIKNQISTQAGYQDVRRFRVKVETRYIL